MFPLVIGEMGANFNHPDFTNCHSRQRVSEGRIRESFADSQLHWGLGSRAFAFFTARQITIIMN